MLKKLIVVAVVGGVSFAALKGTRWGSYVRSEIQSLREVAEAQIPPEKEIARLRGEVKLLDEDTLKLVKQLARVESDQADAVKRLKVLEANKEKAGEVMRGREAAVRAAEEKAKAGEANARVAFGDTTFSLATGKAKLKEAVRDYTDAGKEIARTQAQVDSQQRIIDRLEKQRLAMVGLKADLDLAVNELDEQLQDLNLQQMESRYQTDDTRVARIKEAIAAQKKKFDIQRRELALLQPESRPVGPTESVDDIMAPVGGAKTATKPAPRIEKAD